jgi:hypothetical protein
MYLYIYLDWIITLYSKVYFHILRLNCLMLPPSWYRRVQVARHWRSTMCIIGWWAVPKCHELFSQCLYDLGPFSAVIYIIYIYCAHTHTTHHVAPLLPSPRPSAQAPSIDIHCWLFRLSRPSSPWTWLCASSFWSESFGRLRMFRVSSAWWCAKNGDHHGMPTPCKSLKVVAVVALLFVLCCGLRLKV